MAETVARPAMSPARIWWLASRPRTWPAAMTPVLVGTAVAFLQGGFAPGPALAALLGALLLQIGSNFANDYFDFVKGADTAERIGPLRVTQAGLVTPAQIRLAMGVVFGLATLVGAYLAWVGGWPIVAIGIASILAAIAYTGGPFPLGYWGLGEVTVFLFFGLIAVTGTTYVQTLAFSPLALWLALPIGAWASAILVVNNLRDAPTDVLAGKRTLAVRFGQPFARHLWSVLVFGGFAVPVVLASLGEVRWGACAALLALPLVRGPFRAVYGEPSGPALNAALGGTGKFMMVAGLLLALGLIL